MVLDYSAYGESFIPGKPRRWSETHIFMTGAFQDFDLFPDGKRAIVVEVPHSGGMRPHPVLLFNFFDELKRRIP
jgi:hypothetical protein